MNLKSSPSLLGLVPMLFLAACTSPYPEVSHDGLIRVDNTRADAVYLLPGADLSRYTSITLLEPQIAFREYWQRDINRDRTANRIGDEEMIKIIETGKQLLIEEFTEELEKGGFAVVDRSGPEVLAVRPAIIDLDLTAPDPNNEAGLWVRTYARGAGEATLRLELYDSVSNQLLVRAFDRKSDREDSLSWQIPRTRATNIQDARMAFSDWARMLVKGLKSAEPGGGSGMSMPAPLTGKAAIEEATGRDWILTTLQGEKADVEDPPTLTFLEDNRLAVFGGINRMNGGYSLSEDELDIGNLATTMMAGPTELMELERKFADSLRSVTSVELQGNTLNLLEDGKVIATFLAKE